MAVETDDSFNVPPILGSTPNSSRGALRHAGQSRHFPCGHLSGRHASQRRHGCQAPPNNHQVASKAKKAAKVVAVRLSVTFVADVYLFYRGMETKTVSHPTSKVRLRDEKKAQWLRKDTQPFFVDK